MGFSTCGPWQLRIFLTEGKTIHIHKICTVLRFDSFSGVVFLLTFGTVTRKMLGLTPNIEISIIGPISYRVPNKIPIAPFIREIHAYFKINLEIALIDLDLFPRSNKPNHIVSPIGLQHIKQK